MLGLQLMLTLIYILPAVKRVFIAFSNVKKYRSNGTSLVNYVAYRKKRRDEKQKSSLGGVPIFRTKCQFDMFKLKQ